MTRLEKAIYRVKEILGSKYTIYKALTSCNIVQEVNTFGGQLTIVNFKSIKELESFLDGLEQLQIRGITL